MRGRAVHYGVSLAVVAAAVGSRILLEPLLGDRFPLITVLAAVVFTAWYGGKGPALVALVVGGAAVAFFIMPPRHSFNVDSPDHQVGLAFYGLLSLVCIVTSESLRRAQRRAEEQEKEVRRLNEELEKRVLERARELQEALDNVRRLHGLLPICAWCKRVRDDKNYWHEVETYVAAHTDVQFTHGICPQCLARKGPGAPADDSHK